MWNWEGQALLLQRRGRSLRNNYANYQQKILSNKSFGMPQQKIATFNALKIPTKTICQLVFDEFFFFDNWHSFSAKGIRKYVPVLDIPLPPTHTAGNLGSFATCIMFF